MVNVNDFSNELPTGELLVAIFKRQRELMDKYDPLEEKNLGYPIPHGVFDLDLPACQQRLKDFAWRVTEELAEATECYANQDKTHFHEELIDAFHFFVELLMHSGFEAKDFMLLGHLFAEMVNNTTFEDYSIQHIVWECVEELGKAMNCLKNKPWKQTHMVTDADKYRTALRISFYRFIAVLAFAGFTAETATLVYFNKSDVNCFRIRSQY